jgi:hypothetical protein
MLVLGLLAFIGSWLMGDPKVQQSQRGVIMESFGLSLGML